MGGLACERVTGKDSMIPRARALVYMGLVKHPGGCARTGCFPRVWEPGL